VQWVQTGGLVFVITFGSCILAGPNVRSPIACVMHVYLGGGLPHANLSIGGIACVARHRVTLVLLFGFVDLVRRDVNGLHNGMAWVTMRHESHDRSPTRTPVCPHEWTCNVVGSSSDQCLVDYSWSNEPRVLCT
jgi:hypothetical protein